MVRTKLNNVDDTMNFWVGCNPVSEGCAHCYARRGMKRTRFDSNQVTRTKSWKTKPYALQRQASKEGCVFHVFTCSWSDFFHPGADQWRSEAWAVIKDTPNLVWRILTKRPELIAERLPSDWGKGYLNVGLGVTVEMKKYLWRMDTLRNIPAVVRHVMAEPLLEDLTPEIDGHFDGFHGLMVGGESGPNFRPMDEQWARNLRDTCAANGIPFYFKQHAAYKPQTGDTLDGVKHRQLPAAWATYEPPLKPIGLPGQVAVFDLENCL
jgi:protein gp37